MKEIELANGGIAIVSDEDFESLSQWRWIATPQGYVLRSEYSAADKKTFLYAMHRVVTGARQGEYVHHINCNTLDNRRENLQVLSALDHARIHSDLRQRAAFYTGPATSLQSLLPEKKCPTCGIMFRPKHRNWSKTRCCSKKCSSALRMSTLKANGNAGILFVGGGKNER